MSTNYNDTLVAGRLDSEYLSPSSKFIILNLKSGEVVAELEE